MFQQVILTKRFLVEILLMYSIKHYCVEDRPNSKSYFTVISTSTHPVGFFSLSPLCQFKSLPKCKVGQIETENGTKEVGEDN